MKSTASGRIQRRNSRPGEVRLENWAFGGRIGVCPKTVNLGEGTSAGWNSATVGSTAGAKPMRPSPRTVAPSHSRSTPVGAKEFPDRGLSSRVPIHIEAPVVSDESMPANERIQAFTDSQLESRAAPRVFEKPPDETPSIEVFNGVREGLDNLSPTHFRARLRVAVNPDPNTSIALWSLFALAGTFSHSK